MPKKPDDDGQAKLRKKREQANPDDYEFCAECDRFWPKEGIVTSAPLFGAARRECPKGHELSPAPDPAAATS